MSLEKCLAQVEVEWRELGEIGDFVRGKRFVKTDIRPTGVPCIHYGELYTHYGISAAESKSFLDADLAENLRRANHGDVIIVSAGETIEDIGDGTAWLGEEDVVIHDACFAYKSDLNPVYVSHFLRSKSFKEQIRRHISSGKISSINSNGLGKARIPVPYPADLQKSLAVQAEIVRILGAFNKLTDELVAKLASELISRKNQHEYYRDHLLSFEENVVEWKTIGDVFDLKNGYTPSKSNSEYWTKGEVPWFRMEDIRTNGRVLKESIQKVSKSAVKGQLIPANSLVMSTTATIGEHALIETPFLTNQQITSFTISSAYCGKVDVKFMFHYFYKFGKWCLEKANKNGGMGIIGTAKLKEFQIPIPLPEEQARIVAILDKFDTLANSISEDLPREIELRQKQYGYYRDLLLSFSMPEAAGA